ncbi:MAG: cupredoxin domain-containing protein [Acidobacteria bacterium]|nr:cupredoxin domain-containing protein [Acidobacteriota bacterium]
MLDRKARTRTMALVGALSVSLLLSACAKSTKPGAQDATTPTATVSSPPAAPVAVAADEYIKNRKDIVDAADWDAAQHLAIEWGEAGNTMYFRPKDMTLEAGKPYVFEVNNTGKKKHELVAEAFFRSSAIRKFEDDISEVKVRLATEFEVFAGKKVELFIIPVMPGAYEMVCGIAGHREAGMEGTITVTGQVPSAPAPEIAKLADSGWVQDPKAIIDAADWDAAEKIRIEAGETGDKMWFKPSNIDLKANKPYIITLVNVGKKKHEFVADEFTPTVAFRKAEDASGEFKGLSLDEVEVFAGKEIEVFLIPTKAGSYPLICEIAGHQEAGMVGTITVA